MFEFCINIGAKLVNFGLNFRYSNVLILCTEALYLYLKCFVFICIFWYVVSNLSKKELFIVILNGLSPSSLHRNSSLHLFLSCEEKVMLWIWGNYLWIVENWSPLILIWLNSFMGCRVFLCINISVLIILEILLL